MKSRQQNLFSFELEKHTAEAVVRRCSVKKVFLENNISMFNKTAPDD